MGHMKRTWCVTIWKFFKMLFSTQRCVSFVIQCALAFPFFVRLIGLRRTSHPILRRYLNFIRRWQQRILSSGGARHVVWQKYSHIWGERVARWQHYVPSKRRHITAGLHVVSSQESVLLLSEVPEDVLVSLLVNNNQPTKCTQFVIYT
jgi:hypothetical protein